MAKDSKAVMTTDTAASLMSSMPDYLQGSSGHGLEDLKKVIVPPMIKIRQSTPRDVRLVEEFEEGDVLVMPTYELLQKVDGPAFHIVPVLMFTEYCVCNPLETKDSLPFIRERTMDSTSDIAKKCLMRDKAPKEPCPEMPSKPLRYMQHMNYLVIIEEMPGLHTPVLMSFRSTEFKTGRRFATSIVSRGTDIYSGRYEVTTEDHKNPSGAWKGFRIINDPEQPWVDKDTYEMLGKLHLELKKKLDEGTLRAEYEPEAEPIDDDAPSGFASEEEMTNSSL